MPAELLVLGGTRMARKAATALAASGWQVVYSLAGLTSAPALPCGVRLRTGGFGGAKGLALWLQANKTCAIIDATHPFARTMHSNAAMAARMAAIPCLRLEPPPFQPARRDIWIRVPDAAHAARTIPPHMRLFAALGSHGLAKLAARTDLHIMARVMTPPTWPVPPRWRILITRPSPTMASELARLRALRTQAIICRNSGARSAIPLLHAARILRLPVIMISRPKQEHGKAFHDLKALMAALRKS